MVSAWDGSGHFPSLLESALRDATRHIGGRRAFRKGEVENWRLNIFSDSACISQEPSVLGLLRSLEGVALFQRVMLTHGFLVRGGMSVGSHYESEFALISQALLDAYRLERHESRMPRVILSESVLDLIESISDTSDRHEIKELITFENKILPFVCYLVFEQEDDWMGGESFYERQRDIVQRALSDDSLLPDTKEKYLWLGEYHNWALAETARVLKTSALMTEEDVWWFRTLWMKQITPIRCFDSALRLDRQPPINKNAATYRNGVNWITDWPGDAGFDDDREPDTDAEPENYG
jgi:hypothetical protein